MLHCGAIVSVMLDSEEKRTLVQFLKHNSGLLSFKVSATGKSFHSGIFTVFLELIEIS